MKIVFTGGGTAGHVTPNIALINKLRGEEIYYVGTNGMEKQLVAPLLSGDVREYCEISAFKLQRKATLSNLLLPARLVKSVREAKRHLKRIRPDIVFSKGGYVGLPVTVAAKQLHIPTVIHESDMSAGLANKIASIFATKYLAAFPTVKRAEPVGLVVREEILHGDRKRGLAAMGFDGSKPVLLVTGGSLGAKALNDAVKGCPALAKTFDIFVVCGKNKLTGCDFLHETEFAANMNDLLAAADVCLTRAGANTLAELTLARVPFAAVPLAKQSRGEQLQNAQWFCERGCGVLLREEDLEKKLLPVLTALWNNRTAFAAKQRARQDLYGTDKVVQIIKDCARH